MPVLNTFEGGTAAGALTAANSGGASGDAFDLVSVVSGGAATYTTTAYRGALAGQFASGATAGIVYGEYSTTMGVSSSGSVYGRVRFRLPVLPPDATGVRVLVVADSTGSFRAEVRVNNAGAVSIRGSAGTALVTFSATYSAGTWWDVGLAVLVFSTTVGQIEAKQYASDGTVTQTITSAATQDTVGAGGTNKLQVGMIRSVATYTVIVDDVAWSAAAYPSLPLASSFPFFAQATRRRSIRPARPGTASAPPPQALPAAPVYPAQTVRTRLRGLRLSRTRAAGPLADRIAPPGLQRPRLRVPRLSRGRTSAPTPAQIVVVPPAYPPQSVRTRVRGLRLFRRRASAPVPGQAVVIAPVLVLQSVRARLKGLRLFRGRTVQPNGSRRAAAEQLQRPRLRTPAPRRGHVASPPLPQVVVAPPARAPRPVRARARMVLGRRSRIETPYPNTASTIVPSAPGPVVRSTTRPATSVTSLARAVVTSVRDKLLRSETRGE